MKKSLLPVLLLLTAFTASAQKGKFEYGFQGGVNINKVYGYSIGPTISRGANGLSLGGNTKFNASKHFGIKAQLSYEQFGWVYRELVFESGVFTSTKTDFINKLSYVNLPVLAEYSFGKKVKLKVDAGMYTGVLIKYKIIEKTQLPVPVGVPAVTEYNSKSGRMFSFGLAYGLGVEIPLNTKLALTLDARNYIGLTGINQSSGSTKVATLSLLSGLTFRP